MKDKAYIGDEIVEGNILISQFMDCKIQGTLVRRTTKDWDFPFPFGGLMHPIEDLKYHSSWDWLMPVVERIEKECFKVLISTFGLSDWHYTEIRKGTKHCGYGKSEKKIESTWIAVVDFIKNYNQNKQS